MLEKLAVEAGATVIVLDVRDPEFHAAPAAGKVGGLVDVKVVRFSETHAAHKFVIPVSRRPRPT